MQKHDHDTLKSLVLEVFDKAAGRIETRFENMGEDAKAENVWADIVEEFPVLKFSENAELKEALVDLLIEKGAFPVQDGESADFFLGVLNNIEGRNESHAYNNAVLALNLLSQGYLEKVASAPRASLN